VYRCDIKMGCEIMTDFEFSRFFYVGSVGAVNVINCVLYSECTT
jgi:hypothetical protein